MQTKTKMTKSDAVLLSLTREEAVVLSDWLYRNSRKREYFADAAEQTVFWGIECMLEKVLSPEETRADAVRTAKKYLMQTE